VNAFGADYSAAAAAIAPDGMCSDIARGSFDGTPIGELRTTITPNTIEAYTDNWSLPLDIGGTFVVGDSTDLSNVPPFVIAFVKGGDTPNPLADATDDQGGLSYTWFGGPWTDGLWGRYSSVIDVMMLVKVTYPWGAPIAVNALTQANNTFNTTGPFTIIADLFDDVQNGVAIDGTDEILFHWSLNGGEPTSGALTAANVLPDGNGEYAYDIAGSFAPGDFIEYWVTAVDNDGLPSESIHLGFEIKEPAQPDADLLIIYDSNNDSQLDNALFENVAFDLGIVFEYWNTSAEQGIDASIVNAGWSNIVVYGWGTSNVPAVAGEYDPGFKEFLDAGGNLILADQDWYFGHGLPAELTFAAGDFAYDYFGIGSGSNDPVDENGDAAGDTAFYGIGGTAMDLPFAAAPMVLDHGIYGTSNWADPVVPSTATTIFSGATDGLSYGVAYESGVFKTAYFGFIVDAAVDTTAEGDFVYDQFADFFTGALSWMGVSTPPQISEVAGPTGTVLSGPYAVSAKIIDADGDAITANVLYSGDDGASWTSIPMTADGDTYSAEIPDVSEAGFYYWGIEAVAGGATSTYPAANEEAVEFERFVPTAPTLVVFNGLPTAGYPSSYYFGVGDFSSYSTFDFPHDVWGKGLTGELASAYTNIYEIATDGPGWDNRGVISDWLTEGANNYFLAGDEWFGALTGWADLDYAAGSFEYDVLGISHIHNDINYPDPGPGGASPIEAVAGNILTGKLYDAHTALGDTLMYDPTYEIGIDNWLDGFTPVDPADVNMTTFDNGVDTVYSIGLNRVVGDNKIVFLGFDPLSVNAVPYTWWGFSKQSPQTQSLYWFGAFNGTVGVDGVSNLPTEFSLSQNYPNPFNPTTNISFEIPSSSEVVVSVYNMLGQKVVDLVNGVHAPGVYNVTWNGLDANGKPVGSGLYIYHMSAGDYSATNKMLFLK